MSERSGDDIAVFDGARLRYLSWVRTGLAQAIDTVESVPGPASATVEVAVNVGAEHHTGSTRTVTRQLRLHGPGRVAGIDTAEFIRPEPAAGSLNTEPNLFPSVELASPDLPWRHTPFGPAAGTNRLRPWLVLVCVEVQDGVSIRPSTADGRASLVINSPADPGAELPDLTESWAWTHVEATEEFDTDTELRHALLAHPDRFTARLVSPRRLEPLTSYLACVVPAFDVGVDAGLGVDDVASELDHAWTGDETSVSLPVYFSWSFSTSDAGDFESLVRKVKPAIAPPHVGTHPLDLTRPGPSLPASDDDLYRGPIASPTATEGDWDDAVFRKAIARRQVIEDPDADEPLIGLPIYGTLQTDAGVGWVAALNERPALRAAAGLGARVVQEHQEEFLADAWDQARAHRDATVAINRASLASWVGERVAGNVRDLSDEEVVQLVKPMLVRIPDATGASTAVAALEQGELPRGTVSPTVRRLLRPEGAIVKTVRRTADVTADAPAFTASLEGIDTIELATPNKLADGSVLRDADNLTAVDADLVDTSFERLEEFAGTWGFPADLVVATPRPQSDLLRSDGPKRTRRRGAPSRRRIPGSPATPGSVTVIDRTTPSIVASLGTSASVGQTASLSRTVLDPTGVIAARLSTRITGLETLGSTRIPTTLAFAPSFAEALYGFVEALGSDYVVPGMGDLENNRTTLLEVQPDVVEAIMVGANHEMARELRWREFPTRRGATYFRRFWDVEANADGSIPAPDIDPIDTWTRQLGNHLDPQRGRDSLVFALKAELVERYPDLMVWAAPAQWDGSDREAIVDESVSPNFTALLGRSISLFGLPIPDGTDMVGSPDQAAGRPGWFIVIEQRPGAVRFGLDATRPRPPTPDTWANINWPELRDGDHLNSVRTYLTVAGDHDGKTRPAAGGTLSDTWGVDAAHMARITYQRPVRVFLHASQLIAEEGG